MIEIKIPKEINRYEAKAVGPFSVRQLVCLLICLPAGIGLFMLTKPFIGTDLAGFLVFIPGTIGYLFGWYKPYGLPFEKYLKMTFINSFLAPSKRLYKTENFYSDILREIDKNDVAAGLDSPAGNKKKTASVKKYKRSKEAIR